MCGGIIYAVVGGGVSTITQLTMDSWQYFSYLQKDNCLMLRLVILCEGILTHIRSHR